VITLLLPATTVNDVMSIYNYPQEVITLLLLAAITNDVMSIYNYYVGRK